ncbi:Mo-dependent nitrogenase C-terminal domain-containing protein [Gloeobacter kilaueensis]|uniref:Tellurite resistance protein n=1 Tax=Gloeobacter kilaueensis (strain ATCC BAA-2537 / CCAP 1431/1 / ULC 316 / JS1) TaxID=1183438 RepID=U5QJ12_GLOK1|nr:Mo-dependent nitrogenase C-terminal domain-containing protein [Gloeobacter kilaueensis]AGY58896.1 tellurite resistance protein [Gloeobacter kilaueensis JS1]
MSAVSTTCTREQVTAWLAGLITVAWADGHFDDTERACIQSIVEQEDLPHLLLDAFEPLLPAQLAAALGQQPILAENFLRTAVMVAIADGDYSEPEHQLLMHYCAALGQKVEALESLRSVLDPHGAADQIAGEGHFDALQPMRQWLEGMQIHNPSVARFLCQLIPAQCPFERDIKLPTGKVVHIPAMCKINPLYEQLVGLRFRALSYLADDCHEDVSRFC